MNNSLQTMYIEMVEKALDRYVSTQRCNNDHVLEAMLRKLGADICHKDLPFRPEGGAYGHGRTFGHDHASSHDHSNEHHHNDKGQGHPHDHHHA